MQDIINISRKIKQSATTFINLLLNIKNYSDIKLLKDEIIYYKDNLHFINYIKYLISKINKNIYYFFCELSYIININQYLDLHSQNIYIKKLLLHNIIIYIYTDIKDIEDIKNIKDIKDIKNIEDIEDIEEFSKKYSFLSKYGSLEPKQYYLRKPEKYHKDVVINTDKIYINDKYYTFYGLFNLINNNELYIVFIKYFNYKLIFDLFNNISNEDILKLKYIIKYLSESNMYLFAQLFIEYYFESIKFMFYTKIDGYFKIIKKFILFYKLCKCNKYIYYYFYHLFNYELTFEKGTLGNAAELFFKSYKI